METKQTALEWLLEELKSRDNNTWKYPLLSYKELVMEAKAMEKEQIKDAFVAGIGLDEIIDDCDSIFEIFYEETYGK